MNPAEIIRSENAGHTYGSGQRAVVAVHGATCVVRAGARIALTGPSGSGKSTLLHMMAGLERVTSGEMTWPNFAGHPSGNPQSIGVIFQGPSLIPSLNAVENVALPLLLNGTRPSDASRRALVALAELELDGLAEKLPDELSGGQAQRVAIARVLATRPTVILADEPTGLLDGAAARHVVDVLIHAADELGAALVVSTHDLDIATRLATRWEMHDGRLLTALATTQRTTQLQTPHPASNLNG